MSHQTTLKCFIMDVSALRAACLELQLPLLENTTARGYGGSKHHGDFVIQLRGLYDVALNKQKVVETVDGKRAEIEAYVPSADLYKGNVERELGPGLGRLTQLCAVHTAILEARRRGMRVTRSTTAQGKIKVEATVNA